MMRRVRTRIVGWVSAAARMKESHQIVFHLLRVFFGNDAPVEAERHLVGHHIGVDAAGNQADGQGRMVDARRLRAHLCIALAQCVQRRKNVGGRMQGVVAGVRPRRVRALAQALDFEMQTAVVCGGDAVGKPGRDGEVRLRNALREQPLRADGTAGFFVVSEMQFNRALQRHLRFPQRAQRKGVGGEIGFGHRRAATIQPAITDLGTIGIGAPAFARRHHVAVGVERDHRAAAAECVAHHQVDRALHALRGDHLGRHYVAFDCETEALQQAGGALCVRRASAGRVVRRRLDQLGEKRDLLRAPRHKQSAERSVHAAGASPSVARAAGASR